MGSLTKKTVNEHLYKLDELHTVKVLEEIKHVDVPVYVAKEVEVPVYKEVEVKVPAFVEEEVVVYVLKEKSLATAMKPVVREIERLEKQRADIGRMIAVSVEKSVRECFEELMKKLS